MKATPAQRLQQMAQYNLNSKVLVYTIFDGWQECQIIKLGWDRVFGCVDYYVSSINSNQRWITSEKHMKPCV